MDDYKAMITIDYNVLHQELSQLTPRRVLLEIPRWLKHLTTDIVRETRQHAQDVFISADDVWGACYFNVDLFRRLEADCLVHIGHGRFCKTSFPMVLVPFLFTDRKRLFALLDKATSILRPYQSVHVECSLEFGHYLPEITQLFRDNGMTISHRGSERDLIPTLGCRYEHLKSIEHKAAAILYIGEQFYSDGAVETTSLPLFCVEPYQNEVFEYPSSYTPDFRDRRRALFDQIGRAKQIGIVVETHFGQMRLAQAQWYQAEFHKRHQEAEIVLVTDMSPQKLAVFGSFDLFVNTTCPRVTYFQDFGQLPLVTEQEVLAYLANRPFPERIHHSWLKLPGQRRLRTECVSQ